MTEHARAQFPLGPFTPYEGNPVLGPRGDSWESANVYNPAAVVVDDRVALLYRAHAADLVSHVGLAWSSDGLAFEREDAPVLSPQEPYDAHGVEDPRVTHVDGTYYLTYSGYDGQRALLCLATSRDLRDWERHGPLFPDVNTFGAAPHAPQGAWSKAGGIVPVRVGGRWLMYFGEGSIFHAWSDDLVHWELASPTPVLEPEPGTYGSYLVEVGPPPVVLDNGLLLLLHNAATRDEHGVCYTSGQTLIDPARPGEVLARTERPWLAPRTREERHGLVANVTFVEGLVRHRGTWFCYYGQSDSTLGVATCPAGASYGAPLGR